MIFHLTDEEINRICKACSAYGADGTCSHNNGELVINIKRCNKWNAFYGGKPCVRK
ncbi:MAG: hypothetical protein GXX08_01825 [Firmicutes bacterium]|nr:hypothetical protein [Bacillota bacterium]